LMLLNILTIIELTHSKVKKRIERSVKDRQLDYLKLFIITHFVLLLWILWS